MHPNSRPPSQNLFVLFGSLALLLLPLLEGCSKPESKAEGVAAAEKAPEGATAVRGTNDGPGVTLDAATQKAADIETTAVEKMELSPETIAYARVLDPSTLGTAISDVTSARATSEASQAELKRLETLAGQNNVSDRVLQAGKATAAHDQAQSDAASLRLVSAWGAAIADRKDLPSFIKSLASQESVLVQLNLMAETSLAETPKRVRIASVGQTNTLEGEVLGPAPAVDPVMQGRAFLVLAPNNSLHLSPGMAVTAYLSQPGEPKQGVNLPAKAVIRHNGSAWVYVQNGETNFERKPVMLDRQVEQGWFVPSGLKPGDKVVTEGAQLLLSHELKNAGVTE
jgi:hypothetical protein